MTNPYQTPQTDPDKNHQISLEDLPSFSAFTYPFEIQIKNNLISPTLIITDATGNIVLTATRNFLGLQNLHITSGCPSDQILGKIDRTMFTGGIPPKIYSPHGEAIATLSQPFTSIIAQHALNLTGQHKPYIRYLESNPLSSFFYRLLGGIIGLNLLLKRIIKTRLSILLGTNTTEAMSIEHILSHKRILRLHKHQELSPQDEYLTLIGLVYILLISKVRG